MVAVLLKLATTTIIIIIINIIIRNKFKEFIIIIERFSCCVFRCAFVDNKGGHNDHGGCFNRMPPCVGGGVNCNKREHVNWLRLNDDGGGGAD